MHDIPVEIKAKCFQRDSDSDLDSDSDSKVDNAEQNAMEKQIIEYERLVEVIGQVSKENFKDLWAKSEPLFKQHLKNLKDYSNSKDTSVQRWYV